MNIAIKIAAILIFCSNINFSQQQWRELSSGTTNILTDVYFTSEDTGWVVGYGGAILKTTNGGGNWNVQTSGTSLNLHSVNFVTDQIGWIGGENGLQLKTTNGGSNWQSSTINSDIEDVHDVFFINENIGHAVISKTILGSGYIYENYGDILNSTDGGSNWQIKYSIQDEIYFDLFAIDEDSWSVGTGIAAYSTNYGDNWNYVTPPTMAELHSAFFINESTGWAVGDVILKSTNGGTSWLILMSGVNKLNGVHFINENIGWVVGDSSKMLYSADGGTNWSYPSPPVSSFFREVHFPSENVGYIVGDNGVILKTVSDTIKWKFNLTIIDAGGPESSQILTLGHHPGATDSIDASLGEYELPPPPTTGVFDARLNLPTNPSVSSLIDARDTTQTEITWTLQFQPGIAGYPMTFSWDSTNFLEGTFYLKDRIDGSYVFVNMKNYSSYVLTNPAITSLNIDYKGNCSVVSVNNYWNIISIPLLAEDMELSNLFPSATSSAYGYDDGYVMEDTLVTGKGYWLKFDASEDIQICGALLGDTVQVEEGWNMFGVYEEDILVTQLTTTPPGIIATYFFGFEDGYYIADTIKSGMGHWVRVTSDGVINLNGGALAKDEGKQIAQIDNDWGKIKITDSEGKGITLYAAEEDIESDFYELPPMPPTGIFDARYGSGRLVEALSGEKVIFLSSDKYPITIKAEGLNITLKDRINGELLNEELNSGEEIRITNNKITSIEVTGTITGGAPVSYELYQNYPNPFNPVTKIEYSIPRNEQVVLKVYNALGEEITTLVNERKSAGIYSVDFRSEGLSSGIYLYQITAGEFVDTKKMLLIK